MPLLETAQAAFDYEQHGAGPDLLLLHSLLTDRRSFAAVVPALAQRRRVTLLSLPGFGKTSAVSGSIEDRADRVADFIAAAAEGGSADVLANGYGGFIAVALAARHPRRVGKLVLVDTGAAFPEEGRAPFRAMAAAVRKNGLQAILEGAVRRIFPDRYLAAHPEQAAERKAVILESDPAQFAAACEALARVDLRSVLPRIESPTLVVVGALDSATPPPLSRELEQGIRGARLVELSDCGHCPPLQQPRELLSVVEPFLDG